MGLKMETIQLIISLQAQTGQVLMKTTDDLENAMLFGVPVGVLECETALAALVRYGVDNIRWEIARRGYLELLEERNTK